MKRTIALILVLILCVCLCACGGASDENDVQAEPAATSAPQETTIPEGTENVGSQEDVLVDGMRPAFKDTMDSYEAFFEEYCAFMAKFQENPTDPDLLTAYADYMSQYADTMSKLETLDDGSLNDEELKYYLDVTTRITEMLADIAS